MNIGKNCNLVFTLRLFSDSEKYGRSYYHSEVQYYDENTGKKLINIKRRFDCYISFEQSHAENGIKAFTMIRVEDIRTVRKVVADMETYMVTNMGKIYKYDKNGNILIKKVQKPVELSGLPLNGYLLLTPDVVETFNGTTVAALRINMSDPNASVLIPLKKLSGLIENLNNVNMFLYAQNASCYVGRPLFGTNMYDMTKYQNIEQDTEGVKGRMINKNKSKSFFDND